MDQWLQPLFLSSIPTGLLAAGLWLAKNLILTRLSKSVEYEFNEKIEAVRSEFREKEELLRADIRRREAELAALRSGAMSALESRQIALDKRRLEAIDQVWSAVIELSRRKGVCGFMSALNFDVATKASVDNEQFRDAMRAISPVDDVRKLDLSDARQARPYVTPMVWALFSAYESIVLHALAKATIIQSGIGEPEMLDRTRVQELLVAALPQAREYVEQYGDSGLHHWLDILENALLAQFSEMFTGGQADEEGLARAAHILALSKKLAPAASITPDAGRTIQESSE